MTRTFMPAEFVHFRNGADNGERDWRRIEAARAEQPFASMEDFTRRTRLDEGVVHRLAEAGAFARFEGERRTALWEALYLGRTPAPS